jgi:hypothetical protein
MKPTILLLSFLILQGCELQAQNIRVRDLPKTTHTCDHTYCMQVASQYFELQKAYDELKAKCEGNPDTGSVHKIVRKYSPHSGYIGFSSFEKEETTRKPFDSVNYQPLASFPVKRSDTSITFVNLNGDLTATGLSPAWSTSSGLMTSSGTVTADSRPSDQDYWRKNFTRLSEEFAKYRSVVEEVSQYMSSTSIVTTTASSKSWSSSTSLSSSKTYVNGKLTSSKVSSPINFFHYSEESKDLGERLKQKYLAKK